MNLKQLEAFVKVAETKSFSEAAKQLFLTQPTISAHVSALEKVFAAERERVNMIINSYNDGESCQRVEKSFMLMRYKCLKSKRQ